MKKIITILAILLSVAAAAQEEEGVVNFYAGFDVANAFKGGKLVNGEPRNNNALDFKGGWTLTDKWSNNIDNYYWRFGGFVEYFPAIDYLGLGLEFGTPVRIENSLNWIDFWFIDTSNWETDLVITPYLEGQWVWRNGLPDEVIPENVVVTESFNWALGLEIQFDQILGNSNWDISFDFTLTYRHDKYNIWGRDVDPSGTFPALWENRAAYVSIGYDIFKRKPVSQWKQRGR